VNLRLSVAAGFTLCWAHCPAAVAASCHTTVTFAQQGVWSAYGGPCDGGSAMCGVSTKGTGKFFGLKYFKGDDTFTIQLGASDWRIKNGAEQSVTMEIDDNGTWSAVATGFHFSDGDAGLEFSIRKGQLGQFIQEFEHGEELLIRFPGARDVSDWSASLTGSARITDSFLNCIRAM
jgi:hypothetical protein